MAEDENKTIETIIGAMEGSVLRFDDPFSPACDPEDWHAVRGILLLPYDDANPEVGDAPKTDSASGSARHSVPPSAKP